MRPLFLRFPSLRKISVAHIPLHQNDDVVVVGSQCLRARSEAVGLDRRW